jgi:Flp pilus assembly protein TadG
MLLPQEVCLNEITHTHSGISYVRLTIRTGRRPRGMALIWTSLVLVLMLVISLMAVDYGRAQLAKAELRRAADSAARAGAAELLLDPDDAIDVAKEYAAKHRADGRTVNLLNSDIEVGTWDSKTRVFTRATSNSARMNADAIRVVAQLRADRGTHIPAGLARLTKKGGFDVSAESIALRIEPIAVDQNVLATANPFLAGMPPGTLASPNNPHNSPDFAGTKNNPRQSPETVGMRIIPGSVLQFDGIDGVMRHDPNLAYYQPDGQLNSIGRNTNGPEHGISDIKGPINALVGVFLTDDQPNMTPAPETLDFSSPGSRDFRELRPKLKQVFFIGDGKDSRGVRQDFIVPQGATRLYLASWDFYEWNNNAGYRNVRISRPGKIITVK